KSIPEEAGRRSSTAVCTLACRPTSSRRLVMARQSSALRCEPGEDSFVMQFARKDDFGSIPRATGGIAPPGWARVGCARLDEMGKDPAPVLAKAGVTTEEARNPAIRLEVRTQIRLLELAA